MSSRDKTVRSELRSEKVPRSARIVYYFRELCEIYSDTGHFCGGVIICPRRVRSSCLPCQLREQKILYLCIIPVYWRPSPRYLQGAMPIRCRKAETAKVPYNLTRGRVASVYFYLFYRPRARHEPNGDGDIADLFMRNCPNALRGANGYYDIHLGDVS